MTRLVAEFERASDMREGAKKSAAAGLAASEAISPVSVEDIDKVLLSMTAPRSLGWTMTVAGFTGIILGYLLQWYSAVIAFPFLSGGRPLNSWPVFVLVPYEAAILFAAITGFVAWLAECRFPRLNHPLFEDDAIRRATGDRYVLVFERNDDEIDHLEAMLTGSAAMQRVSP